MKTVTKKVSIGSDQLAKEFHEQFGVTELTAQKANRKTVQLGEIQVVIPESQEEAVLMVQNGTISYKLIALQIGTSAQNVYRKQFTKKGDAAEVAAHREEARRLLFTPEAAEYRDRYLAIPAADSTKVNALLDEVYEALLAE